MQHVIYLQTELHWGNGAGCVITDGGVVLLYWWLEEAELRILRVSVSAWALETKSYVTRWIVVRSGNLKSAIDSPWRALQNGVIERPQTTIFMNLRMISSDVDEVRLGYVGIPQAAQINRSWKGPRDIRIVLLDSLTRSENDALLRILLSGLQRLLVCLILRVDYEHEVFHNVTFKSTNSLNTWNFANWALPLYSVVDTHQDQPLKIVLAW